MLYIGFNIPYKEVVSFHGGFIFKMTTVIDMVLILLLENLSILVVLPELCLVSTINSHTLNNA